MNLGLKDARALVTGGTRGIGRAVAEALADEGVDVAICARHEEAVAEAVAALEKRGIRSFGRALDVGDRPALRSFVAEAADAFGGLDIVVANASALVDGGNEAAFDEAFRVDLMHTMVLADAAKPHLEKSTRGAFISIASISGVEVYGLGSVAYGSMKAALLYSMKCLANGWAKSSIRVNVVSPGTTYFEGGFWEGVEKNAPKDFAETIAENPTGRMAKPEEIAAAVTFLASPVSGFTMGANLVVDGGFTRRVQN